MRTINSDFLRSYDKIKDDVFHAKKEEHKNELRKKVKPLESLKLKKIFPWRTLVKLTSLTGLVYLAYNYTDSLIDYAIKKNIVTMIDMIAYKVMREDAIVKLKTLITDPKEIKNTSHFSNYMYQI